LFKRKFSLSTLLVSLLLAVVLTFQITFVSLREAYRSELRQQQLTQSEQAAKLDQIVKLLKDYCIYDVDEGYSEDMALTAYLAASGDPYAQYFTPEAYASLLSADAGNNVGIGIMVTDTEKGLLVASVMLCSPAETAGILAGDVITKVDGTSLADKSYTDKANLLLGKEGQTLALTLLRGEETKSVSVTRQKYESPSVTGRLLPDGKTALVRIEEFNGTTAAPFKELTASLAAQGAKAFVYDLRGNPGGSLDSVVAVLDYLLPKGRLVTLENRSGITRVFDSDESSFDYPAIILTSGTTASAAELFSACMRDYGAARLLGETTFGKGVAQSIITLPDGSALKFTTDKYYSPKTKNYDGVGLKPDIEVKCPETLTDFAHADYENDPQLQKAVQTLWNNAE